MGISLTEAEVDMTVKLYPDISTARLTENDTYLKRPRLQRLLEYAIDYPLIVVCAGAGYGKTRALDLFLREYQSNMVWMQISERDNITTRFWESYSKLVSMKWPEIGERITEIGFPDTEETHRKYLQMMQCAANIPGKHIRVFDDFHLLHNPAIMRFFERTVLMIPSNVTLVFISRITPDINIVEMLMRERVFTIQEDTLRFTEDEIADYFKQMGLQVPRAEIRNIYDDTQGWAFAINLIGRSLAKEKRYERYALEAMKKNIFRFIEAEISGSVSQPLWNFLMRLSLIDNLAASLVKELAKDDALIMKMEGLNAYIRYDFHMDTYLIHHLFRDYLRQEQAHLLTDEERKETYKIAGMWCEENGYYTDALSYYEKSGDYYAIARRIARFNVQVPQDIAQYADSIFSRAPDEVKTVNPIFISMYMKLKISLGKFEEARMLAQKYAEFHEKQPDSPLRNRALATIYAAWALLRLMMCTNDDVYDFDIYWEKMVEYYDKNPFEIYGAYNMTPSSAWATHVGTDRAEAQEEYISAFTRAIPNLSRIFNGAYIGFDDLVRGELLFNRGEFDAAEQYLIQAFDKARPYDQYTTYNRALLYLMRIAIYHGDFQAATRRLEEMEAMLSGKDYGVRYAMYDVASSLYWFMLERPDKLAEWLKGDFLPSAHSSFIETYGNRIKTHYHYHSRRFGAMLAFLEQELEKQTILFSKVEMTIMKTLALYRLKRRREAIATFTEAYELAKSNRLDVMFTQYAKEMRTFTAAALKDENCTIPKDWLKDIGSKSSTYAKRRSKMQAEYRLANNIEEGIALSERESAVLKDLAQGLSRTEIASSQRISPNTVKRVIASVYNKLYVTSLPDAIRVAVEQKLI